VTDVTTRARYLGVDLAWSGTATSGVCVLDAGGRILDDGAVEATDLVDWVHRWRGRRSVLAIDGPLVVPPDSGTLRPVEVKLHRRYGGRHAGPFPGGARSTAMRGRSLSPAADLVAAVGDYVVDPADTTSPHRAIEVFPAPTWLELFALPERIRYKRGRLSERVAALHEVDALLAQLLNADPPLGPAVGGELDARWASARTGSDWKAVEDILDARLCAYVALCWGRTPDPAWVLTGDADWRAGYVVVPARGGTASPHHPPPKLATRPSVAPATRGQPPALCWCGCGGTTSARSAFLPGHDRVAEAAVIAVEYGGVAAFLERHGFGPGPADRNARRELDELRRRR
jgi:predicted RNase H-like nuclease